MIKTIRNFFKVARLLSTIDNNDLRVSNVQTMGKSQKVMLFTPYGLMHNPPEDSMVLVWSQQGRESNGIGMADDPANRILKGLNPGEVAVGNYTTGAYIMFDEQGACKIVADNIEFTSSTFVHNGINVGDTHVHSQGNDSGGSAEQDTEGPH